MGPPHPGGHVSIPSSGQLYALADRAWGTWRAWACIMGLPLFSCMTSGKLC